MTAYLGVISAHVVAGTGLFSDWAASLSDVFGGRSGSYARQLEAINQEALGQLRQRAASLGADAVVAVSVDHDEVSGGGKAMFMVTVTGTAVQLARSTNQGSPVSGDSVLGQSVRDRAWLIHLFRKLENGDAPTEEELRRIVASRDPAFGPLLLRIAGLPLDRRPVNFVSTSERKGVFASYLEGIPPEAAKDLLYDALIEPSTPYGTHDQLTLLLTSLSLVSLEHSRRVLESDSVRGKVHVLPTLRHVQEHYTAADLDRMNELADMLPGAFPDEAIPEERKGMMGVKTIWRCGYCDDERSEQNIPCGRCRRDRRALLSQDSPESVAKSLSLLREALAQELGVSDGASSPSAD